MNKELQIGHLLENQDREGCPVSIQWDKEDGENWIILKDVRGHVIMKVQKQLWDGDKKNIIGFTPAIRDSIIEKIRGLYG